MQGAQIGAGGMTAPDPLMLTTARMHYTKPLTASLDEIPQCLPNILLIIGIGVETFTSFTSGSIFLLHILHFIQRIRGPLALYVE